MELRSALQTARLARARLRFLEKTCPTHKFAKCCSIVISTHRDKENKSLSLEVRLASQTTRLADLELTGSEAAAAAAAALGREAALTQRLAELEAQCAVAEEAAARSEEGAVAAALEGVAAQISDIEVKTVSLWAVSKSMLRLHAS